MTISPHWREELQRCRFCDHPVPPPVGLMRRDLFRLSRCPGCGGVNPHPAEQQEFRHTLRTLALGLMVLGATLAAIAAVPVNVDLVALLHDVAAASGGAQAS